jgi:hypothetical protein
MPLAGMAVDLGWWPGGRAASGALDVPWLYGLGDMEQNVKVLGSVRFFVYLA